MHVKNVLQKFRVQRDHTVYRMKKTITNSLVRLSVNKTKNYQIAFQSVVVHIRQWAHHQEEHTQARMRTMCLSIRRKTHRHHPFKQGRYSSSCLCSYCSVYDDLLFLKHFCSDNNIPHSSSLSFHFHTQNIYINDKYIFV